MKNLFAISLALALFAGQAYGLGAKPAGVTGDRGFDSMLENLNASANADPDGYYRQLSIRQGIPEQDLRQAKDRFGLGYSDLYMASALAKVKNRSILGVAEDYQQNRGKGWGVMAQEMGIKPGSDEFHAMKRGARGSLDYMKADVPKRQKHEQALKQEHERKAKRDDMANKHETGKSKQAQDANKNEENKGRGKTR
ncbi:MAG TPA: hypothetical protein VLT84_11815 [Acidobacteriota bacterium]|nr:hypothetical protein [Acidobacteriota bacterium]